MCTRDARLYMLIAKHAKRALLLVAVIQLVFSPSHSWLYASAVRSGNNVTDFRFLPAPPALRSRVGFWEQIFTHYSSTQVVIHDADKPERIFSVLDFGSHSGTMPKRSLERLIASRVKREKQRVTSRLRDLAWRRAKGKALSAEQKRTLALFPSAVSSRELRAAAGRVRSQPGLREKFRGGLERSHRYQSQITEILREKGLPVELAAIPLIESSFHSAAYSRVGAAGIWQFMPATGRQFMVVSRLIDERLDPIHATRAAADLLRRNFSALKSWPLAITAYNHGRAGVARAVARTRSRELAVIIKRYRGRMFGFASQNFYAEFLAALKVKENPEEYFRSLSLMPPLRTDEVSLRGAVRLRDAARLAGLSGRELARLNAALRPPLVASNGWVPAGFSLWLPEGGADDFALRYEKLPTRKKRSYPSLAELRRAGRGGQKIHRVRRGQTLGQIARLYGTSVRKIKRRNQIRNVHRIRVGQLLKIPSS